MEQVLQTEIYHCGLTFLSVPFHFVFIFLLILLCFVFLLVTFFYPLHWAHIMRDLSLQGAFSPLNVESQFPTQGSNFRPLHCKADSFLFFVRQILNHWVMREVPILFLILRTVLVTKQMFNTAFLLLFSFYYF